MIRSVQKNKFHLQFFRFNQFPGPFVSISCQIEWEIAKHLLAQMEQQPKSLLGFFVQISAILLHASKLNRVPIGKQPKMHIQHVKDVC
jgi:hypothetical protein